MAKKKKQTRKKKVEEAPAYERSPFWAYAGAVLLLLSAVFLLLGGFGTGGPLPVNLFKGTYWMFGWAAYLTPVALAYWGAYKFTAEDRRIPLSKLMSMIAVLAFSSSWAHVAFAEKTQQPGGLPEWTGGHGGEFGMGLGNVVLSALDKFPASLANSLC